MVAKLDLWEIKRETCHHKIAHYETLGKEVRELKREGEGSKNVNAFKKRMKKYMTFRARKKSLKIKFYLQRLHFYPCLKWHNFQSFLL